MFTSDQPVGSRARGDWGGLIINGRAPVNRPGGLYVGEGDTGISGGTDPNDNSGTMRYVRVEFAGVEFSPDNELNGIAFQAVGRGGTYDFLQVHMNRDDAFEWFGGTANIKHAIASNAADDSFDWTFGWTGTRAVRRHSSARRRRGPRHRSGQQRVQQQRSAALEPAALQLHDVRRPGHATRVASPRLPPRSAAARRSRSGTS